MRINIFNIKIEEDRYRLKVLHFSHLTIIVLMILLRIFFEFKFFKGPVEFLIIIPFYQLYFKTVKELFYTYWTFTILLIIYILIWFFRGYNNSHLPYSELASIAMLLVLAESYLISSPIFFPRIRWWEYDFRLREDLKILIVQRGKDSEVFEFEGRISDLRRNAGCIVSFLEFKTGEIIEFKTLGKYKQMTFKTEIMSKREYLLGRGLTYGVKFKGETKEEKRNYRDLLKVWQKVVSHRKELNLKLNKTTVNS